jgi:hypothetical protein
MYNVALNLSRRWDPLQTWNAHDTGWPAIFPLATLARDTTFGQRVSGPDLDTGFGAWLG